MQSPRSWFVRNMRDQPTPLLKALRALRTRSSARSNTTRRPYPLRPRAVRCRARLPDSVGVYAVAAGSGAWGGFLRALRRAAGRFAARRRSSSCSLRFSAPRPARTGGVPPGPGVNGETGSERNFLVTTMFGTAVRRGAAVPPRQLNRAEAEAVNGAQPGVNER